VHGKDKEDRRRYTVKKNRFTDALGLRLSRQALRVLRERGIFAQPSVSLQHQQLASRYVIRGMESGGAAGDIGHYVTFAQEDGGPIEYLHHVEAIGVNGLHSVVLAPVLVRLDLLRKGRTYELLITRHAPGKTDNGRRPELETKVLFRGVHGRLELDLSGKDRAQAGAASPTFYSLSGEEVAIPEHFKQAVCSITKAVNCTGCSHCHYVRAPHKDRVARIDSASKGPGPGTPPERIDSHEAAISAGSPRETMPLVDVA
jgi:hypothetical protein